MSESSNRGSTLNDKLLLHNPTQKASMETRDSDPLYSTYQRPSLREITTREFYQQEHWFEGLCEALFKIKARNTTIQSEVYNGVIHFISCLFCLAVVPQQLSAAGYNNNNTAVAVALTSGLGSICCGLFANLPFVLAPPTAVTIFQSVFLQQNGIGPREGNYGVIISGALLMLVGWRPLGNLIKQLIPLPIQVGTVVGVGLLTTLAGSTEINFVIGGTYKILRMGHITQEIVIAFAGVIMICVAMRHHIKGSFCLVVIFCSLLWWIYDRSFPEEVFAVPTVTYAAFNNDVDNSHLPLLTVDLLFLYVLYLNGLMASLSNLAVLTREDGATPRGRWIYILSGLFTICGGLISSAPILVSPESSAAIKEGAKTGLSALVAGVLFLFAAFLGPLFERVPSAGTSPVLIMIGVILFQNVNRIDWRNVADAAPAFVVLFYIPFTYSIIQGVILGYIMYLSITLCTGELFENLIVLYLYYFPDMEEKLAQYTLLAPYMPHRETAETDEESGEKLIIDTGLVSGVSPRGGDSSPHVGFAASSASRRASRASANRSIHDLNVLLGDQADLNPSFGTQDGPLSTSSARRKSRLNSAAPEHAPDFSTSFFGEDGGDMVGNSTKSSNRGIASNNGDDEYMRI